MYKYRFVQADADGFFQQPDHRQTIEANAREGWRFITAIPTGFNGHGKILNFDLVFEREVPPETEES